MGDDDAGGPETAERRAELLAKLEQLYAQVIALETKGLEPEPEAEPQSKPKRKHRSNTRASGKQLGPPQLEAQKEATLLRQQLAVFDDDLTAAKHREAKALKDVQGMKDELDLERANLRDELEGFVKAREAVNQELVRVQVDRDNALKDAKKVEEYKEEEE